MQPILPSSLKWTPLPEELSQNIQSLLEGEHLESMPHCSIIVEGRIYAEEVHLRMGYRPKDQLTQYNFEFASLYQKKEQVEERIKKFLDLGSQLLGEHRDCDGEMDLPRQWKKLDDDVYMQYSTVNTDLEAEADRLLALDDDSLIRNQLDATDPLDQAFFVDDADTLSEIHKKFKTKSTEGPKNSSVH